MKKFIIGIIVGIILFTIAVGIGNFIFDKYANVENVSNEVAINEVSNTNIKNSDEIESRGLFDLGDGLTYYEVDLMANDMKWHDGVRLYSKVITTNDDYTKYQKRLNVLPEIDFEKDALIIIANENIRDEDESNLYIYDVDTNDDTMKIIMRQRKDPTLNNNNVFYAVIDKNLVKENVAVEISK